MLEGLAAKINMDEKEREERKNFKIEYNGVGGEGTGLPNMKVVEGRGGSSPKPGVSSVALNILLFCTLIHSSTHPPTHSLVLFAN